MPLSKLAAFVDWPEEKLLSYLLSFKHKMFVGAKDSGVEVEDISDLDFYIDKASYDTLIELLKRINLNARLLGHDSHC